MQGLTLIEILTVVSVIAILIGLLLPATSAVRRMAKEAKQKAQFTAIGLALETFKNDYGQYPASNPSPLPPNIAYYGGAQKLAEALLGLDLLGYNPASNLSLNETNGSTVQHTSLYTAATLDQRQGLYIDLDKANAYEVGQGRDSGGVNHFGLYADYQPLTPGAHVLCDVYSRQDIVLQDGQKRKVGAPILYYRADPSKKTIRLDGSKSTSDLIYDFEDNRVLIDIRVGDSPEVNVTSEYRPFHSGNLTYLEAFYGSDTRIGYIQDPTVTARAWPYNPDTYILISAGQDGIYGTKDDIRNFGN